MAMITINTIAPVNTLKVADRIFEMDVKGAFYASKVNSDNITGLPLRNAVELSNNSGRGMIGALTESRDMTEYMIDWVQDPDLLSYFKMNLHFLDIILIPSEYSGAGLETRILAHTERQIRELCLRHIGKMIIQGIDTDDWLKTEYFQPSFGGLSDNSLSIVASLMSVYVPTMFDWQCAFDKWRAAH